MSKPMSDIVLDAKPISAGIPTFKPSQEQEKYIRDGLAYLVVRHVFYAHPIYNELQIVYTEDERVKFAATDAKFIYFNPDNMKAVGMGVAEVAFVAAHEVSHWLFGHLLLNQKYLAEGCVLVRNGKRLDFYPGVMNMAEDYIINAQLVEGRVGRMPQVGLFDKTISEKGMEGTNDIYEKLIRDAKKVTVTYGVLGGGRQGGAGGGFDVHLPVNRNQQRQEDSGAKTQAIAAALEAARAANQMGSLPGAVQRLVGELLNPKVPWEEQLSATMTRAAGDPIYDWRRLDKRLLVRPDPMYFASQAHTGAGTVVWANDTSGSITNAMIQRFFSEAAAIAERLNPLTMVVMWCDAAVHRVDELEEVNDLTQYHELISREGAGGGGGTSFVPVFEKIAEMGLEPDMVVYFTDTYGTFPHEQPPYPVIWCSVTPAPKVPWGEVIHVEL